MTIRDVKQAIFEAGFDLARRTANPDFRQFMKKIGWKSGSHIVPALDGEPVIDVIGRIILHTDSRVLIAIVDSREEFGFRFMFAEVVKEKPRKLAFRHARREHILTLGPKANIGMLYDALKPVGTYVPSEWTAELRFEKTPA